MNTALIALAASVALLTAGCAGADVEEETREPAVEQPAALSPAADAEDGENVGRVSSALCLHRCVEIGWGCRICQCEAGGSRLICYGNLASKASRTASPGEIDAPLEDVAEAPRAASLN